MSESQPEIPGDSPPPEDSILSIPGVPPPSVNLNHPLIDSYSFYSPDLSSPPSTKGKEKELVPLEGDWMLGVDEAGSLGALLAVKDAELNQFNQRSWTCRRTSSLWNCFL